MRLATPLRTEAQEDHATLAIRDLDRSGLALDSIGPDQVSAGERRPLLGVARENRALEIRLRFECRPALEHHDRICREPGHQGVLRVFDVNLQQTPGAEEL